MGSLFRRLLWLGPTLVLVTLFAFGVLSTTLPGDSQSSLPLFFNPDPGAVERLSLSALESVAADAPDAQAARVELAQLGGAALPFVLPRLDSLRPAARARVVRALRPVGMRMGFDFELGVVAEREVVFWSRFWDEHSIDFRPIVAERAVVRLAQRSTSLREAEVRQLDTYALDPLVEHLHPVRDETDVSRVMRLSSLAADISGQAALRLAPGAGLSEARRVAADWTDWWGRHRTRFKTYRGTERVTAMLSDTRYGGWAAEAARRRLGLLRDGRAAGDVLLDGVFVTLLLLAAGVVGGWMAGVLWGAVSSLSLRRWTRALEAFAVALAALPLAVVVALAGAFWAPARGDVWVGAALMLLAGAPLMSLYRNATTRPRETEGFVRTLRSLGVSQWEAGLATVKLSSPVIVTQLGAQASSLLTLAFVVEFALDLPGLGTRTIQALHEPDLNWLMAITVFTVLFVGLLQALSEWLLDRLDPRLRDRGHAWEEPL